MPRKANVNISLFNDIRISEEKIYLEFSKGQVLAEAIEVKIVSTNQLSQKYWSISYESSFIVDDLRTDQDKLTGEKLV